MGIRTFSLRRLRKGPGAFGARPAFFVAFPQGEVPKLRGKDPLEVPPVRGGRCLGSGPFGLALGVFLRRPFCPAAGSLLLLNSLTDIYSGYIYDAFALVLGAAGIVLRLAGGKGALLDALFGALLGAGVIILIILVSRGGMGWGDAWLMAGIGAVLGWKLAAVALYFGFIVGGAVALVLLAARIVRRKDPIPLGPFLAIGAFLSLLVGPELWGWFGYSMNWPWA